MVKSALPEPDPDLHTMGHGHILARYALEEKEIRAADLWGPDTHPRRDRERM